MSPTPREDMEYATSLISFLTIKTARASLVLTESLGSRTKIHQ